MLLPTRRHDSGTFRRYLEQIGRVPLLTLAEEKLLSERIDEGERRALGAILGSAVARAELAAAAPELASGVVGIARIAHIPDANDARAARACVRVLAGAARSPDATRARWVERLVRLRLTREVFARIARRVDDERGDSIRAGLAIADRAKAKLVEHNLRLVVSVAKRYRASSLSLADLVQDGNIGLMHAVDKFDHTRGHKLSTYATWWIRQAIRRAIADRDTSIRLPVHTVDRRRRVQRAEQGFVQLHGRDATDEELAVACALPANAVHVLRTIAPETVSLDAPAGSHGERSLLELLSDGTHAEWADREVRFLEKLLDVLPVRERRVIELRFGLAAPERTLEEIGAELGVTRERVRQLEHVALDKIRRRVEADARVHDVEDRPKKADRR